MANISICFSKNKYVISNLSLLPDGRILYGMYRNFKLLDLTTLKSYDIITAHSLLYYTHMFGVLSNGIHGPRIAVSCYKNIIFTEK